MIFSSNNQLNCFFVFLFFGFLCGIISQIIFAIFLKNHQNKIIKPIFDTIFYTFLTIFYTFLTIYFNFGEFSLVLLLSFLVGFFWVKNITKKMFVIFENKCYNILTKLFQRKKREHKSKKN